MKGESEMLPEIVPSTKLSEDDQKYQQSPQKRRGRPEKKIQPFPEDAEELFTVHDNIFHVAVLFYTFRVFDKAPTRKKFNPTIGFSVYDKVKQLEPELKKYYDDDSVAQAQAHEFQDNPNVVQFFKNCLTFGPRCVIDEFFLLFQFILARLRDGIEITAESCLLFLSDHKLCYINFENQVLDFLQAKTSHIRQLLRETIQAQLCKLLGILVHTLECIHSGQRQNKFAYILQSEEDMFERGVHSKTKKRIKKQ